MAKDATQELNSQQGNRTGPDGFVDCRGGSGAFIHFWRVVAIGALACIAFAAEAATPGLPLTEPFDDIDLRDSPLTSADWSEKDSAVKLPVAARIYGAYPVDPNDSMSSLDVGTLADPTTSIALGDMDGDGDLDLVVGNNGEPNLLYLNDGTANPFATIPPSNISPQADRTEDIALADFDRDGDLDVVAANAGGESSRLYLNNGSVEPFAGVIGIDLPFVGSQSIGIAAGDVDNDGDTDLVFANNSQAVNRYLLNNGTANPFAGQTSVAITLTEDNSTSVELVDIDNDGDLDLLVGNTDAFNFLHLNNGSSTPFEGSSGLRIGTVITDTTSIRAADVNGDGLIDVLTGDISNANQYYLNNGSASPYSDPGGSIGTGFDSTLEISVGDIDNDGDYDVVAVNNPPERNKFSLNFGTAGLFSPSGASPLATEISNDLFAARAIALGDVDRDGDLDVVIGNFGAVNRYHPNTGNFNPFNGATRGTLDDPDRSDSRDVKVADVNGDGFDDIIVANTTHNILINGDFETPPVFTPIFGWQIFPAAVGGGDWVRNFPGYVPPSGDGPIFPLSGVASALAQGAAGASPEHRLEQTVQIPSTATIATFSWADLIRSQAALGPDQFYEVRVASLTGGPLPITPYGTAMGDANLQNSWVQHDVDLSAFIGETVQISFVVHNMNGFFNVHVDNVRLDVGNETQVHLNRSGTGGGGGGRLFADGLSASATAVALALGDLDKDGDLDMAVARSLTNTSQVLFNDGNGVYTGAIDLEVFPVSSDSLSIAMGDIDSDGDVDVVVGHNGRNRISLNQFQETGGAVTMTDTDVIDLSVDSATTSALLLEDVDGDGDLDVIAGNGDVTGAVGRNRLYLNNGTADPFNGIAGTDITTDADATVSLVLGDVDRDGDLDLIAGNVNGVNKLYLNDGTTSPFATTGVGIPIGADMLALDTRDVLLVDMDRDGDLDLFTANHGAGIQNHFYLSDGSSSPFANSVAQEYHNDGLIPNTVAQASGDFDRDGDPDLVMVNGSLTGFEENRYLLSVDTPTLFGNNAISQNATLDVHATVDVVTGDLDGDGDIDVIVGNSGEPNRLYLNDGSSAPFESITGVDVTADANFTQTLELVDIDSDGDLDLIEGNRFQLNRIYLNNGTADPFNGVTGIDIVVDLHNTVGIAAGDYDCDSDIDLVVANANGPLLLYLNNGTGDPFDAVTPSVLFDYSMAGSDTPSDVAMGDISGDSFPDIVVGLINSANAYFENNRSGGVVSQLAVGSLFIGFNTSVIELADLNQDGTLDIIEGVNGGQNQLWFNQGPPGMPVGGRTGYFPNFSSGLGNDFSQTRAIAVADINLDGALDIIAANGTSSNQEANLLYIGGGGGGGGGGVFNPFAGTVGVSYAPDNLASSGIAVLDMTGDGLPDVFEGNESSFGPGPFAPGVNRLFSRKSFNVRPAIANSIRVDTEGSNITVAKLTPTENVLPNSFVDYFLSNNGGAQYFRVIEGQQFVFPTAGTDLRWRAELRSLAPQITPIVDQIDITGPAANVAPVLTDINVTVIEDLFRDFLATDFLNAFTDADNDAIQFIRFASLPTNGDLTLDGAPVGPGQTVPLADIGLLKYRPNAQFNSTDTFNWNAFDGTAFAAADRAVIVTVAPVADTPSVVNTSTDEDVQTFSGLRISRAPGDGTEVTHFKITNIRNGVLYQNDGTTPIADGQFITFFEGDLGLRFTPAPNVFASGLFDIRASISDNDSGLGGGVIQARITVAAKADTPSVSNALTLEDTQTTMGLVVSRHPSDGVEVAYFKITGIQGGALFENDGLTPIVDGDFITATKGLIGLRFTPSMDSIAIGQFVVEASLTNVDSGIGGMSATALITVAPVPDEPAITGASTLEDTQTTGGLVISRNVADGAEVSHFKITGITGGEVFKNDGVTRINEGNFVTFAEGNAGLRFTPAQDSTVDGSITIQGATAANSSSLGGPTVKATIVVTPVNDPPVANPDNYALNQGGTLNSANNTLVDSVLRNDTDVENDLLTAKLGLSPRRAAGGETQVAGFGSNALGQLDPQIFTDAIDIAAGDAHSLALKRDGTVVGWGSDDQGEATPPAGLQGVTAIAAGGEHSLALTSDGLVVGWGKNDDGQATPPMGLTDVVAIAAGDSHSAALKSNGTVVAWGKNDDGQATPPPGLTGVIAISAGGLHNLALKNDGTVVGWGKNDDGQTAPPVGLDDVFAIAAGALHSVALKADGTVVAWGSNASGQLDAPMGLQDVVGVAAGALHSVALKDDGTLVAWGGNTDGESMPPAGLSGVVRISALGTFNLYLRQTVAPDFSLNPDGNFIYEHDGSETSVDFFTYKANDGTDNGKLTTVTFQIGPINGPPIVTVPAAQMVNEDEQLIISGTTVSDPDAGANPLVVNLSVLHGTIGLTSSAGLTLVDGDGSDGRLTFTGTQTDLTAALQSSIIYQGLPDYNGPDTLTVDVNDQGNTGLGQELSDVKTVAITINPINDEPSIIATAPPAALEDAGPVTTLNWATFVPGPQDENGQSVVEYTVSNLSDPAAFQIPPAVSNGGDLTYTPETDFFGTVTFDLSVQDDGMTADGGDDVSQLFTYTITVNAVNDRPTFAAVNPVPAVEDSGLQSEPGWVASFTPGPLNEVGQTPLFYTVTNIEKPELFAVPPAISVNGDLDYTLAPDAFGTSMFDVSVTDNGGVGNNGINTSLPQTFEITVTGVNDKPAISAVDPPAILEDAGQQTVVGWAVLQPGAANEVDDTVMTYTVPPVPVGFFAVDPAVTPNGDLTYTVAADVNGSATFDIQVQDSGDGMDTSDIQTFTVTVGAVNDPPTFTANALAPVQEDAPQQDIVGWAINFDPGPVDEGGQMIVEYVVSNVQAGFFAATPTVAVNGDLSFTPAANAFGSGTFDVQVRDSGGEDDGGVDLSPARTVTVTVTGVNDPPTFTAVDPPAALEDSGEQTVSGWATFSAGDGNEIDGVLTYNMGVVGDPTLFATPPAVSVDGDLTYTPAPNAVGQSTFEVSVQDDGGTAPPGDDTSPTQTFTITVNGVNDAPTFTAMPQVTVLEDSGSQSMPGWVTSFTPGPADEVMAGQAVVQYTVSNVSVPGLFEVEPQVSAAGVLTFKPASDVSGSSLFDVVVQDDGGVAENGENMSVPQTFEIIVSAVNDEPSFAAVNPPQTIEDAGPQTVVDWATFDPGSPNELGQAALEYFVGVVSNPGLFAAGGEPAVAPNGDLTYTLAPNVNGDAEIDVAVRDDGGFGVGDDDTSQTQRFTISARAVNDAPSIVAFDPPASLEDQGEQTVPGWVQLFVPGPVDESGQSVIAYTVGGIEDPALFATEPAIDLTGALTYTPAANASGSSTFTVTAQDDGQRADNGEDTSAAQTFVITVTGVNDQPSFTASNPPAVVEDAGPQTIPAWAEFDAGPNESMQQVSQYIISPPTDATLFSAGPLISASGDLTYTPADNAHGTFNFTVAVQDNGGTTDNGVDTSDPPQAFAIVINSVNDTPVVGVPATATLDEDDSTLISGLSVSDADANEDLLSVTLSVASGALAFVNPAGVTVTDADGSDGSLAFTGGQSAATAVLQAGATYTPNSNFNGDDALVVLADDQGSFGPDGAKIGMGIVTITVNPIADTPLVADATTDEDVQTSSGLTIARGAGDGAETTHMRITGISGGALFKNDGVTLIAEGEYIPADDGVSGLRFTPAENSVANGFFTVQASTANNLAGLGGMPVTATITVNSVNDPPVFVLPAPATSPEDGSTVISDIEVSDADAGANPILMTVSVGHGSISLTSSTGIDFTVPDGDDGSDGTLSFSGTQTAITDAFKNSILYTPTPDYDGPDTLTLSADDQGQSGGDPETTVAMLAITVVGENDRPTTVGIPDFVVTLNSMNSVINLAATFDDVEDADPDLAFSILSNTNPGLFDLVAIDAVAGTLTLDYAADKPGSSFITLRCADTGGLTVDATFRVSVIDIQESKLVASDAASVDWFGWSVAISGDWLVVGAHRDDDAGESSGAAYVYRRQAGAEDRWVEVKKLTADDAAEGDEFGRSVAIAGDTIVVGANGDDDRGDRSGSGYVFQRDQGGADQWEQVAKINSNSGAAGDRFGWSVAIHLNTIVVGAPRDDDNGSDAGAAFVFERDAGGPGKWGQTRALLPADSGGVDFWFGNSVAIDGDDAIIGQPFDQASGTDSGSAVVFGRNNGGADSWGQTKKLIPNDAAADDWFGWAVSLSGGTAVVGATRDDVDGRVDAGSGYVFQRNQGGTDQWGEVRKLVSTDNDAGDSFGFSVSISGDAVVIGAHNDNDKGDNSGSVYLFGRNQGGMNQWSQSGKLTAADGEAGDVFGYSVAIDGDSFAVGAPNSDEAGSDSGSAYLFRIGSTLDLFRSANFSAMDLADPAKEATVWGDKADPDMDGQSNFFEFVAGLNPTVQASKFEFRIEAVPGQPTHRRLIFSPIVAGRTYHVEVNTNLGKGPFTTLTGATVENNGVVRTVTDLNATGFRTYRVRLSVP